MWLFSHPGRSQSELVPQSLNIATNRPWGLGPNETFLPLTLGHFSSQGIPAMTSTASAPPTPMQMPPRPPPLGVWESVPIRRTPG